MGDMNQITVWVPSRSELDFAIYPFEKYDTKYEIREKNGRFALFA